MDLFLLWNPKMLNSGVLQLLESLFRLQSQPISQCYEKHEDTETAKDFKGLQWMGSLKFLESNILIII